MFTKTKLLLWITIMYIGSVEILLSLGLKIKKCGCNQNVLYVWHFFPFSPFFPPQLAGHWKIIENYIMAHLKGNCYI